MTAQMAKITKRPTFLWQAMLISLPLLVLLIVGLSYLRQDRVLALREATDRAQRVASSLVAACEAALVSSPRGSPDGWCPAFQVDAQGALLFPPPVPPLSPRPLMANTLTREQGHLWRTGRELEAQQTGVAEAIEAYNGFLSLHPPADFSANAIYSLGLLQAAQGNSDAARSQFKSLLENQPEPRAESGLPLKPLCLLKLVELSTNAAPLEQVKAVTDLCSNLVHQPTVLSSALFGDAMRFASTLDAATTVQQYSRTWQFHQQSRALHAAARRHFADSQVRPPGSAGELPLAFWFTVDQPSNATSTRLASGTRAADSNAEESWFCVRHADSSPGFSYRCWMGLQAVSEVTAALARIAPALDYLGIEIAISDKVVCPLNVGAAGSWSAQSEVAPELLCAARRSENGTDFLKVSAYLVRPDLLYKQQENRRLWFGSLMGVSAIAALIGLLASWRAFVRQRRLNELKSNFVSSVSHELRTPVAAVQLLVAGLENGSVSPPWKQKQYLSLIRQECRRLSLLIENILDVSRIERGRKEFKIEPTDIVALIEQTVTMIEPYAAERKVTLALSLPGGAFGQAHPRILLDRGAVEQALLNLIDNAIKHSPEGETVRIGLDWVGDGQAPSPGSENSAESVALWVEDRGEGIPAVELEKIFEPFHRRGSEMRRETQGVGIGLSIVKHLVEGQGGRVSVRSTVGRGSRFVIQFPIKPPQALSALENEHLQRTHSPG